MVGLLDQQQGGGVLGGFGQRLDNVLSSDAWSNLLAGLSSGGNTMQGLALGGVGYARGKQSDKQRMVDEQKVAKSEAEDTVRRQQMNEWLRSRSGLAPADQQFLASNPQMAEQYAQRALTPKPTSGFGLQPVYYRDASGNLQAGQISEAGGMSPLNLPQGAQWAPPMQTVDLGTNIGQVSSRGGLQGALIPKDVAGVAAAEEQGKGVGAAALALPAAQQTAALVNDQVQSLKTDPYLDRMLGPIDSRLPNFTTDAARVQGKIDQLQGGAFLQARQLLKGGGAITDYEGQKAEAAFVRMNTAQSLSDFNAALDEFNAAVQQGAAKLQMQAGRQGGAPMASPQQAPASVQTFTWSPDGGLVPR